MNNLEEELEVYFCTFPWEWKQRLFYFALILECDYPILEALFHWKRTQLSWNGQQSSVVASALSAFIRTSLYQIRPDWTGSTFPSYSKMYRTGESVFIWLNQHLPKKPYRRRFVIVVYNTRKRTETLCVFSAALGDQRMFLKYTDGFGHNTVSVLHTGHLQEELRMALEILLNPN